jgi:hypothetical protein
VVVQRQVARTVAHPVTTNEQSTAWVAQPVTMNEQSTCWVAAPPTALRCPSSSLRNVSRLSESFFNDFLIGFSLPG